MANRWLDLVMFDKRPLNPNLSGLALEYRIIQLYSRDVGKRSAEWCIEAVDTCWNAKKGQISAADRNAAKRAYDQAKNIYRQILKESKRL